MTFEHKGLFPGQVVRILHVDIHALASVEGMRVACVVEEVDASTVSEGLNGALGDGVAADLVGKSYGHDVKVDVWDAALKKAEDGCAVGAWFCGVKRYFEHVLFLVLLRPLRRGACKCGRYCRGLESV